MSFSCKSQQKNIEIELKECVNETINRYIDNYYGYGKLDFYPFIIELENSLIESGLLKDSSKKEYMNFFDEFSINEKGIIYGKEFEKIEILMKENKFDIRNSLLLLDLIKNCPYKIIKENNLSQESLLYKQTLTVEKLYGSDSGFGDKNILYSFIKNINSKEFEKIVYRAPVILLVYTNMKIRYDKE